VPVRDSESLKQWPTLTLRVAYFGQYLRKRILISFR
jgi:hypothetical protein